jgi:murein DD-endopeptidase MepM/ murein hydrolase activator NlpD
MLESDPIDVFALAMLEHGGNAKTIEQICHVAAANGGIARERIDSAWTKVSKELLNSRSVRVAGQAKGRKLTWIGQSIPMTTTPETAGSLAARVSEPIDLQGGTSDLNEQIPTGESNSDNDPAVLDSGSLNEEDLTQIVLRRSAARQPLGWAARALAAGLASADLTDLPEDTVALLFAHVARVPTEWEERVNSWAASAGALEVLTLACAEASADPSSPNLTSLLSLAQRVSAKNISPKVSPALADATRVLSQDRSAAGVRRTTTAIDLLKAAVTKHGIEGVSTEMASVLRAIEHVPFEAAGGRSALMAVLNSRESSLIQSVRAWQGLTWESLLDGASGALQPVVANPFVRESVVLPHVRRALQEADRRNLIAEILGAPRVIAELVEGDQLANALRRVAASDSQLAAWLQPIGNESAMQHLRESLAEAQGAKEISIRAEYETREKLEHALEKLADAEARLRDSATASAELHESERRQLVADAATVIAKITATVEQDLDTDSNRLVLEKLWAFGARVDVLPFGVRGESVPFDPELHKSPGTRPDIGAPVIVARSGYQWKNGSRTDVLIPALVSPDESYPTL